VCRQTRALVNEGPPLSTCTINSKLRRDVPLSTIEHAMPLMSGALSARMVSAHVAFRWEDAACELCKYMEGACRKLLQQPHGSIHQTIRAITVKILECFVYVTWQPSAAAPEVPEVQHTVRTTYCTHCTKAALNRLAALASTV
jgi:uncharacterized protein YcnI